MKKIILVLVVLLVGGASMAQNVIGSPVYYTDSTQYRPGHGLDFEHPAHMHRVTPNHHRMRTVRNDFNQVFLETRLMVGQLDVSVGFDVAYVFPSDWGIYASWMWGHYYDWPSMGAVYRLSSPGDDLDWQLYGGLVFGPAAGLEGGVRLAFDNWGRNNLSWWSLNMGVMEVQGYSFLTLGCSLGIGLWWW